MRRHVLPLIMIAAGLALAGARPASAQATEWALKVSADEAQVHARPDASSPVVATLARGAALKSAAREGDWFRVVVEAGRERAVVIGWVGAKDVSVTGTAGEAPDLWAEASDEFAGVGLSVRVGGGLLFFGSGDISAGALGEFDRSTAAVTASGAQITRQERRAVTSGTNIAGDLIYRLGPRLGVGIRVDYIHSYPQSSILFRYPGSVNDYTLDTTPLVEVYALRPGLYYERPLNRWLIFLANGGPAVHFARYEFARRFVVPGREDDIRQKVTATRFGLQGGLGLELMLNKRAGLFVEVQGRYARIGGLEGTEWVYTWDSFETTNTSTKGVLSTGTKGGYPILSVQAEDSAGTEGGRAVLDLSGISFAAGVRVRF